MRKEAIKWDILPWQMGKKASCTGVTIVVFIHYRRYKITGCCFTMDVIECYLYGRLPQWQTVMCRGLNGKSLNDQITKGGWLSTWTAQLSGPGITSWKFRKQIKG
jgi:hypothetical protein